MQPASPANPSPSLIYGPWQLNEQDDYYAVHASDVDAPVLGNLVCKLPLGAQGEERGRLIAAAPELLEHTKLAARVLRLLFGGLPPVLAMEASILKARDGITRGPVASQPVSSADLIALLDDPAVAAAVNEQGGGRSA